MSRPVGPMAVLSSEITRWIQGRELEGMEPWRAGPGVLELFAGVLVPLVVSVCSMAGAFHGNLLRRCGSLSIRRCSGSFPHHLRGGGA